MRFKVTDVQPEPPGAGPDYEPREFTIGYVEAENATLAYRKLRKAFPKALSPQIGGAE